MRKYAALTVLILSSWSCLGHAESSGDRSAKVKPNQVQLALKSWEAIYANQMKLGADWVNFGLDWEKMQKRMDYIARTCEPEKVAGMSARKKKGKELADKFINSFAPAASLPTFSEDEKADPCAIAKRLPELKKAKLGIREAWSGAAASGFITELGNGYQELYQGYKSYSDFGPISSFFATEIFCQGVVDPGPTLKVGVKKLGSFYRTTQGLVENLHKLERQTDELIEESSKMARLCPATVPAVEQPADAGFSITSPVQKNDEETPGGVAR